MSKRSTNNLRTPQEIKLDQSRNYGYYIKDEQKKQHTRPDKHTTHTDQQASIILRDPGTNDTRKCYECECTNDKGYCDNYMLYAVMRGICRVPVKEDVYGR
jgi:hypothetical protein